MYSTFSLFPKYLTPVTCKTAERKLVRASNELCVTTVFFVSQSTGFCSDSNYPWFPRELVMLLDVYLTLDDN